MAPRKASRRVQIDKVAQDLEHLDPDKRKQAAEDLAGFGTAAATHSPRLVEIFRDEVALLFVRDAAIHALAMVDVGAVVPFLSHAELPMRRMAVRALGAPKVDAQSLSCQLVHCLGDIDAQVRQDAVRALAGLGAAAAQHITAVTERLSDGDSGVQTAAAVALGKIGIRDGSHIDALVAFVRDQRGNVRHCLANSWRRDGCSVGDHEAVKILCKCAPGGTAVAQVLVDYIECPEVGRSVEAFFRGSGADGANVLAQELSNTQPAARAAVAAERAETALAVRAAVVAAAARAETALLKEVKLTKVLGSCGAAAIPHADVLAHGLEDQKVRFHAAKALAGLAGGTTHCATALARCLTDRDEAVRVQAAKALGRLGLDAEAQVDELRRVANGDKSGAVRTAAGEAVNILAYVVLTLHISSSSTDGMFVISCTNMAGGEMASIEVAVGQPMRDVQAAIARELGRQQRFKMTLVSGYVLRIEDLDRPVVDFVGVQADVLSDDTLI